MKKTITLTEKEAAQIIANYLDQHHNVETVKVKFNCTDNYPGAKDYEGNWVQSVVAEVEPSRGSMHIGLNSLASQIASVENGNTIPR